MINLALQKQLLKEQLIQDKELAIALFVKAMYRNEYIVKVFMDTIEIPDNYIPIGSVEWVEGYLGKFIKPDYFPNFLNQFLYRKIWISNSSDHKLYGKFIKPADRYKLFDGFIFTGDQENKFSGEYWVSDVVNFVNEFRYYVTRGKIIFSSWYKGDNDELKPPELDFKIPNTWSGTIDMGYLDTGEFALVECHHPYACGWYGNYNNGKIFIDWLVNGWEYINELIKKIREKERS